MDIMYEFKEIDKMYEIYHFALLESDDLRPCKSVTRDVENTINKFITMYKNTKKMVFSEGEALKALGLDEVKDTFNTNIRTMKELSLLSIDNGEYAFTQDFVRLVNNGLGAGELVLNKLYSISSINDMSMYLNSLICTLREGYLRGKIYTFPDSNEQFIKCVPDESKRMEFREMVKDIYGFCGRYKTIDDTYTPNANYRVITELKNLNLIKQTEKNGDINQFTLTTNGLHLLRTINENLALNSDRHTIGKEWQNEGAKSNGYNRIFYGVPGCGKSWYIDNVVLKDVNKKEDVFRTTFYLDYSNSDFVGQIYPVIQGKKVTYDYVPGPFTKALERALTVEDGHMTYLVIEEINRGNAAAIFGDIFQLLDRLSEPKDGREKGASEYPISNQFIEGYFKSQNDKGKNIPYEGGNIYIPNNLTILATMNTSDQNVYPLDTAFQRRWDREKVVSKLEGSKYAELTVPGTSIKWKVFASIINLHMIEDCKDGSVTEDKNLGAYFATDAMLCNGSETTEQKREKAIRFANNVLEYLFGTAVKFEPKILFGSKYDRYQKVYDNLECISFDQDQSEAFIDMFADKVAQDLESSIHSSYNPALHENGEQL